MSSLCPEGERLYLRWTELLKGNAPRKEITAARAAYRKHCKDCEQCREYTYPKGGKE